MELFPEFMSKAGSKLHSKFIFGDSKESNLFRDFKNVNQSKDIYTKNLMPYNTAIAPPAHSFAIHYGKNVGENDKQIFANLVTSDVEERNFFQQNVLNDNRLDRNSDYE